MKLRSPRCICRSSLGSAISVESPTFKAASASSKSEHQRKARASQNGAEVQYQYFEALGDEPDLCASLFGNRNPPEFSEVLRKTMRLYQQERYNVDLHEGEDTLSLEELRRVVDELFPKEPEDEEVAALDTGLVQAGFYFSSLRHPPQHQQSWCANRPLESCRQSVQFLRERGCCLQECEG